jgi:hypothetical protein
MESKQPTQPNQPSLFSQEDTETLAALLSHPLLKHYLAIKHAEVTQQVMALDPADASTPYRLAEARGRAYILHTLYEGI